jgi:hypothetical protein
MAQSVVHSHGNLATPMWCLRYSCLGSICQVWSYVPALPLQSPSLCQICLRSPEPCGILPTATCSSRLPQPTRYDLPAFINHVLLSKTIKAATGSPSPRRLACSPIIPAHISWQTTWHHARSLSNADSSVRRYGRDYIIADSRQVW